MATDGPAFNEDDLYDLFPAGESDGSGHEQGFNSWQKVNDASLFTEEALRRPAVREFIEAPFDVTFGQFKSSHRETEYFIHKPHLAMTGQVDGIDGFVGHVTGDDQHITTLVINHEHTLARFITRSIVVSDANGTIGQIIHKQPEP